MSLGDARDGDQVDRLLEELGRAEAIGGEAVPLLGIGGEGDDGGVRGEHRGRGHDLESAIVLGAEAEVGDDEVEAPGVERGKRLAGVGGGGDGHARNVEQVAEGVPDGELVLDDEDAAWSVEGVADGLLHSLDGS